jgi:Ras-related protein Rab-21
VVPLDEAETYARGVGAQHFVTSAKLNKNVNELFLYLTKEMLAKAAGRPKPGGRGGGGGGYQRPDGGGLIISDAPAQEGTGGGCCS